MQGVQTYCITFHLPLLTLMASMITFERCKRLVVENIVVRIDVHHENILARGLGTETFVGTPGETLGWKRYEEARRKGSAERLDDV